MRWKQYATLLAVVALGVIVALFWRDFDDRRGDSNPVPPGEYSVEFSSTGDQAILNTHLGAGSTERSQSSSRQGYWAVVVDSDGVGIDGVCGRWSGLPGELRGPTAVEWEPSLVHSMGDHVSTVSNSDGRLEFEQPPLSDSSTTFIWLSKDGFKPKLVVLSGGVTDWQGPQRWTLEETDSITVRVVDSTGAPVNDAVVSLHGARPPNRGFYTLSDAEHGEGFLALGEVTDESGEVSFPAMNYNVVIQASKGRFSSSVWSGKLNSKVVLTVLATFSVSGQVVVEDSLSDGPHGSILVQSVDGGLVTSSQAFPIDESLVWGPFEIPLDGASEFVFSAQGRGWIGTRHRISNPKPDSHHKIDLNAELGQDLWAVITDELGEPIEDAQFSAYWADQFGSHVKRTRTYAGGVARLRGCPPRAVQVEARAKGFDGRSAQVALPQQVPEALYFILEPGTRLTGRCTNNGLPVREFEVLVWQVSDPGSALRFMVRQSVEGYFEIPGVPDGLLQIMARGPGESSSQTITVDTRLPAARNVHLELKPHALVKGRVVDIYGVAPMGGFVQARIGNQMIGDRWILDSSGKFEGGIPDVLGRVHLTVGADGFALLQTAHIIERRGVSDVGTITLQVAGEAHFRIDHEAGFQTTACTLYCQDCPVLERSFDVGGHLIQPSMSEGTHFLQLDLPDGSSGFVSTSVRHGPADPTVIELDGTEQVDVRIVDYSLEGRGSMFAELRPRPEVGRVKLSRQIEVPANGLAAFQWIKPGLNTLRIQDSAGEIVQTQFIEVKKGQRNYVEVSLEAEPVRIRIVGVNGELFSGATVNIHHGNRMLVGTFFANAEGEVDIFPADNSPIYLCVQATTGEVAWNVPVGEMSKFGDVRKEIVLDCSASLQVELFDTSGPLPDRPVKLVGDQIELDVSSTQATNPQGRATFDKLSAGEYLVQVFLPGYWPYNKLFEAKVDGGVTRIKIPRIADLKVRVEGAGGQPVAGKSITVWSLDYDKDVKRWWEVGALDPSPVTWMTDEQGEFVIPVMPEGPFRVSCPGAETTITLVPDGENLATLRLDS